MAQLLLITLLLLSAHSSAQQCRKFVYNPNVLPHQQDGKAKSSSPGLDWLAQYSLPVPKSAYDAKAASYHLNQQNNLDLMNWDVNARYLDCLNDHQIYTDVTLGYCNATAGENANGTCPHHLWVGLPQWIQEDLSDWGGFVFGYDNKTFANYGKWFMEQANATKPPSVLKQLDKQSKNISNKATEEYYGIIGAYLGVGFNVSCRAHIANTIQGSDAFDQAGWQAATTLMALVPVLLTFGNLFVARSSEAFGTSFLVGTMSAVFSLGLPVKSISGIKEKQRVTVSHFEFYARQTIAIFGKPLRRSHATGDRRGAAYPAKLEDLQKWSVEPPKNTAHLVLSEEQQASDCSFGDIRRRALKWDRRAHMWHVSALLVAVVQGVLFLFTIGPLFVGFGTPLLIFDCHNYWTSLWLIVSAGISALFRLAMWETGAHERGKIFCLSGRSISSLRQLINQSRAYTLGSEEGYLLNTTETQLPPLHPAILTSISHSLYRIWIASVTRIFPRALSLSYRKKSRNESIDSAYEGTEPQGDLLEKPTAMPSRLRLRLEAVVLWTTIWTALKSPLQFLRSGYSKESKHTTPMRYRPLMILMHLSTEGRNPLVTLFTGAVEGLILIVLTVFFGAAWGGNLLVLCYVMAVLLVTVTAGRALGLWYVVRSAKLFGLHVIETQSPRQIIGCLRILCSMKEVLVFVNSAWFFEGHRLDEREGWAEWKLAYERGDYDEDISSGSMSRQTRRETSIVSDKPPKVSVSTHHNDDSTELVSPIGSLRLPRRSTERATQPDEEIGMAVFYTPGTGTNTATPERSASQTTNSTSRRPAYRYERTASSSIPLAERHPWPPQRQEDDS